MQSPGGLASLNLQPSRPQKAEMEGNIHSERYMASNDASAESTIPKKDQPPVAGTTLSHSHQAQSVHLVAVEDGGHESISNI